MIKNQLGSQSSLNKLANLTIKNLSANQFHHLSKLLIDFNESMRLSRYQIKAIENLIKRSFRIFYLYHLKIINIQLIALRTDLL